MSIEGLVRASTVGDLDAILRVERAAWGDDAASVEQIQSRIVNYAEGNPIFIAGSECIGYGSTMILSSHREGDFSWDEITDSGYISHHVAYGALLYGVSASVVPGKDPNILDRLIEHCVQEGLKRGCKELCLGSRIPGYARWYQQHEYGTLDAYITLTSSAGAPIDPLLRRYTQSGFSIVRPLRQYFPDPASRNHGVLISLPLQ